MLVPFKLQLPGIDSDPCREERVNGGMHTRPVTFRLDSGAVVLLSNLYITRSISS